MIRLFVLANVGLASVLFFCSGLSARNRSKTATVHLRIVNDSTGEDLGLAKVDAFQRKYGDVPSPNFADRFRQNTALNIPYDFYKLCADTAGFWTGCTEVPVYQSDVWVILGLRFGGWQNTVVLTGVVKNVPTTESPVWVRLVGIYSSFSASTKVNDSGHFEMSAWPGKYVLVTIQGGRILDTRAVLIPTSSPVIIEVHGATGSTNPTPSSILNPAH